MATYHAVVKIPDTSFGTGFTPGAPKISTPPPVFPTSLGQALNGYSPYDAPVGGWFYGHQWPDTTTAPSVPWAIGALLWDVGNNSPDGDLSAAAIISNIFLNVGFGNSANTLDVFWFTSNSALGPYYTSADGNFATNPVTGLTWTRADLFSQFFGLTATGGDYSSNIPNGYFTHFGPGDTIAAGSDLFGFMEAIVTYTLPVPTEVDVTGQGGLELGGAATITQGRIVDGQGGVMLGRSSAGSAFGAGTGPAAELHLNQWGLEAFMLDTDRNEHLG